MSSLEVQRLAAAVERLCLVVAAQYAAQLGEVDQKAKAEQLSRCGLTSAEIAKLLGSTVNAVNVALHRARKTHKKKKPAGKKRR
jgi:hypothetical protein